MNVKDCFRNCKSFWFCLDVIKTSKKTWNNIVFPKQALRSENNFNRSKMPALLSYKTLFYILYLCKHLLLVSVQMYFNVFQQKKKKKMLVKKIVVLYLNTKNSCSQKPNRQIKNNSFVKKFVQNSYSFKNIKLSEIPFSKIVYNLYTFVEWNVLIWWLFFIFEPVYNNSYWSIYVL